MAIAACTTAACAQVRVQGDAAALRVEARTSRVADILSALEPALNVRYRSSVALDRAVNATYEGSLQYVLSRVLDGYNYVVKRHGGKIEIVVIGNTGGGRAVPPAQAKGAAGSLTAKWRSQPDKRTPAQ